MAFLESNLRGGLKWNVLMLVFLNFRRPLVRPAANAHGEGAA